MNRSRGVLYVRPQRENARSVRRPTSVHRTNRQIHNHNIIRPTLARTGIHSILRLSSPNYVLINETIIIATPYGRNNRPGRRRPNTNGQVLNNRLTINLHLVGNVRQIRWASCDSLFIIKRSLRRKRIFLINRRVFPGHSVYR